MIIMYYDQGYTVPGGWRNSLSFERVCVIIQPSSIFLFVKTFVQTGETQ